MYLQINNDRERIMELFNDQKQMLGIIYSQLMNDSGKFRIGGEVYHTTIRAEVVPIEYKYEQERYLLAVSVRSNFSERISFTNHTVELKLVDNFGKMELYIGQRGRVIKRKNNLQVS